MSAVMAVSGALFCGAVAALLVARRHLARALEAERLDAELARELAHFDQRCARKGRTERPAASDVEPARGAREGRA